MINSQANNFFTKEKMRLIRFFSSFGDGKTAGETFYRLCQMDKDQDYGKKYKFVTDNTFTHAIIMNTATPILNIPKENVLGLAFEPLEYLGLTPNFIEYAKKYIGKYYIGSAKGLPEPFVEHFSFMWFNQIPSVIQPKTKKMSIIFSQKQEAPGHKYRLELVLQIIKLGLPIDIFGFGCMMLAGIKDDRIKGSFQNVEPFVGYEMHICIENYRHPTYISEKFMDPVLQGCIPIYLGAYQIDEIFPNSHIPLSGDLESDIKLISLLATGIASADGIKPVYPESLKLNEHIKKLWL